MARIPNTPDLWQKHPLGPPNRGTIAVFDYPDLHHRFALGRYNQYADPAILNITRHLSLPGAEKNDASRALARLMRDIRRYLPSVKAVATYTTPPARGTVYKATGYVYVANHGGKKRWIRTI